MVKRILYTLGGIIVFIISAGGLMLWESKQPKLALSTSPLLQLFKDAEYQKTIKRIDSSNKILLVGKVRDGIKLFIDYYISLPSVKEKYNVKRRSLSSLYLKYPGNPISGIISEFIHNKIFSKIWPRPKSNKNNLWLLDNGENSIIDIDMVEVNDLIVRNPNDKFIILNTPTYQQVAGFKYIGFQRPQQQKLIVLLQGNGFQNRIQAVNVLNYFNKDYRHISLMLLNQNPSVFWRKKFEPFCSKIKKFLQAQDKAQQLLKKLCKQGEAEGKKNLKLKPEYGVIGFDEGTYYWTDFNYNFAYSSLMNQQCVYATQIASNLQKKESKYKVQKPGESNQSVNQVVSSIQQVDQQKKSPTNNQKQLQKTKNPKQSAKQRTKKNQKK